MQAQDTIAGALPEGSSRIRINLRLMIHSREMAFCALILGVASPERNVDKDHRKQSGSDVGERPGTSEGNCSPNQRNSFGKDQLAGYECHAGQIDSRHGDSRSDRNPALRQVPKLGSCDVGAT